MIVVGLKKKGSFVDIELDNLAVIKVPYDLFLKNNLYVGDEIDEKKIEFLIEQTKLYLIKQSAFRYLGLRNHSKYELILKLQKKGYEKELLLVAINDIAKQGFIDDKKYTEQFISFQLKKKKGINRIKAELFKKGIDRKIIENGCRNYDDFEIQLSSAKELANKKYNFLLNKKLDKIKLQQKIYQYLLSRGFPSEIIKKSVKELEAKEYEHRQN